MEAYPVVYVCVRCLTPAGESGKCHLCGGDRIGCEPGSLENPDRRPVMDSKGKLRTRAPLWWLFQSVPGFSIHEDEE